MRAWAAPSRARRPSGPAPRARRRMATDAALEFPSTSHICVVDAEGNAVAMTTTIEDGFGSRLMTEGGFLLNNELTDFSFVPIENGKPVANRVEAGKRPRSSMAPTIVYDRSGGSTWSPARPAAARSSTTSRRRSSACSTGGSIRRPRSRCRISAAATARPSSKRTRPWRRSRRSCEALGHETRVIEQTSGLQAIVRTKDGWIGGADPRREGTVRGD